MCFLYVRTYHTYTFNIAHTHTHTFVVFCCKLRRVIYVPSMIFYVCLIAYIYGNPAWTVHACHLKSGTAHERGVSIASWCHWLLQMVLGNHGT